MVEILLDTTFLLPTLGLEVKGITSKDFEFLAEISANSGSPTRNNKLFASHLSFVEIFGKIAKTESMNAEVVQRGIKSLLESNTYSWIIPSADALNHAFKLRLKGHRDNIDNILYSIAFTSKMLFLSIDSSLKHFLEQNGFEAKMLVSPRELQKLMILPRNSEGSARPRIAKTS